MSRDLSPAARRRASCSRWLAASRGSSEVVIVYAPSASSLHCWAIWVWPPLSGLMYQVSCGGPASAEPQAASVAPRASAAPAATSRRRPDGRTGSLTVSLLLVGSRRTARSRTVLHDGAGTVTVPTS